MYELFSEAEVIVLNCHCFLSQFNHNERKAHSASGLVFGAFRTVC